MSKNNKLVIQVLVDNPYFQIMLYAQELVEEIRKKQGLKTIELCLRFIKEYWKLKPAKQKGKSTYYRKRTPLNSGIDINKSINEQFNLFRVVDDKRYSAFFGEMVRNVI